MVSWYIRNKFIAACCLTLLGSDLFAQQDLFKLWPDSVLAEANSAQDVDYMTEQEKEAIFIINLVRINPPLFADTYLKDYFKENGIRKDKDIKELISELKTAPQMAPLKPHWQLTEFARRHATDMGQSGRTGHNSSQGKDFKDRIARLQENFQAVNENCNYGNEDGVDAVIDLLIDRNVPNAGHRKNILHPEMEFVGVAIEPHTRWKFNCVQIFATKK